METAEESSFTLRMLQRASLRRSNNNLHRSGLDLKRRLSIMEAIEDKSSKRRQLARGPNSSSPTYAPRSSQRSSKSPVDRDENKSPARKSASKDANFATQRFDENNTPEVRSASRLASFTSSFNESEEFNKDLSMASSRRSGDFDSFKWRRPHYGGSYQVKARSNDERSFHVEEMLKPQLLKVKQAELESPRRIQMESRGKEGKENRTAPTVVAKPREENTRAKDEREPSMDYTNSSITSIYREIDEIDRKIRELELKRDAYDRTKSEAIDEVNFRGKEREPKPPRKSIPLSANNSRPVRSQKHRQQAGREDGIDSRDDPLLNAQNPYSGLRRILEDTVANKNRNNAALSGNREKEVDYAQLNVALEEASRDLERDVVAKIEENNNDVNLETMESAGPRFAKNPALHGPSAKMQRCHKLVPNLESTRRSSKFDLTKKHSQTNMESTISSITTFATQMTSESLQEQPKHDDDVDDADNYENTIPPEVEGFLEEALGDELNNTSVTYAPADARDAMSQYNASEFISDGDSLRRGVEEEEGEESKPYPFKDVPKYYGTLNRTRTLCRSFTQRLKKKLQTRLKDRRYVISNPIVLPKWENEKMQMLLQELDIQQTLLHQASKALNLCYAMKNFTAGPEHVESERLLLLTDLKKRAILEEIKRIGSVKGSCDPSRERGEITIKDVALPLSKNLSEMASMADDRMEWFVVTVTHGSTVWASHAVPRDALDATIRFPEAVSVSRLSPDFKILVRVYSLRLKVVPAETKLPNPPKSQWKASCSSVRKIWRRTQKPMSTKQRQILCSFVRNTSFCLAGQLELTLEDISLCSPWTLSSVQANSTLRGTIELELSCKLHISESHAGFLTHGDEAGGYAVWNRRWCLLEGHVLKFWNYPQEQESKGPLARIDLMHCVSNEVSVIDRRLCAKPRTFVVRTARPRSVQDHDSMLLECRPACTVVRNLLSCDTADDLMEWTTKLNRVISLLHEWNALTTYDAVEISDL